MHISAQARIKRSIVLKLSASSSSQNSCCGLLPLNWVINRETRSFRTLITFNSAVRADKTYLKIYSSTRLEFFSENVLNLADEMNFWVCFTRTWLMSVFGVDSHPSGSPPAISSSGVCYYWQAGNMCLFSKDSLLHYQGIKKSLLFGWAASPDGPTRFGLAMTLRTLFPLSLFDHYTVNMCVPPNRRKQLVGGSPDEWVRFRSGNDFSV